MITRSSDNEVMWRWDTDPFGTTLPNQNPQSLGTFVYNLRFPGQYYNAETGLHYNYFRDYDPQAGRYVESDPIGLGGGVNIYAYALGNPIAGSDPLGLKDWNERETRQLLQQAFDSATAGRLQGLVDMYNNSKGNGPYDFGYGDAAEDTWTRCGVIMDADHFANYVAGFQGAAYDEAFFWTTGLIWGEVAIKTAGIAYHITGRTKAKRDPFDRTGFPMINAGEKDGWNFHKQQGCVCAP